MTFVQIAELATKRVLFFKKKEENFLLRKGGGGGGGGGVKRILCKHNIEINLHINCFFVPIR